MSKERAGKWIWGLLAALVATHFYFVRELLAALLLFSLLFVTAALLALVFYLAGEAGERSIAWAESYLRPVVGMARRRLVALEELSKKSFHRPRSEPVR